MGDQSFPSDVRRAERIARKIYGRYASPAVNELEDGEDVDLKGPDHTRTHEADGIQRSNQLSFQERDRNVSASTSADEALERCVGSASKILPFNWEGGRNTRREAKRDQPVGQDRRDSRRVGVCNRRTRPGAAETSARRADNNTSLHVPVRYNTYQGGPKVRYTKTGARRSFLLWRKLWPSRLK